MCPSCEAVEDLHSPSPQTNGSNAVNGNESHDDRVNGSSETNGSKFWLVFKRHSLQISMAIVW